MAEYIDREKIFPNNVFYVNENNPNTSIDELINRIYSIPATDVIPVVRCKNCVYANDHASICHYGVGRDVKPDHYCGYGERKCDNE
jgi:hypothetical protein